MSLFGKAGSKVLAAAAALTLPFSLLVTAPAFAVDATQSEDEATTAEASPSLPDVESAASAYPFGYVDSVSSVHGGVMVRGWAIDPDTRDAIQVHVYSGGVNRGATWANESRPDVDSAHKMGPNNGFSFFLGTEFTTGPTIVYGINNAPGNNPVLGTKSAPASARPFGHLDSISGKNGSVRLRGGRSIRIRVTPSTYTFIVMALSCRA